MNRPKFSAKREKCINDAEKAIAGQVKRMQSSLFNEVFSHLAENLDTEGGKLKTTPHNFAVTRQLDSIYRGWNDERALKLTQTLIKALDQLHKDNERFFANASGKDIAGPSLEAFNILMGRIGYRANKDQLIKGGFLQSLIDSNDPVTELKNVALRAIVSGQSLAELKKSLDIVSMGTDTNPGVLERHYRTHLFDIYQQYDREVGRLLATSLDLKYAIYQGGLIKTSRPFCVVRNDRVFTIAEIVQFGTKHDKLGGYSNKEAGDFQGKTSPYNPFLDLGGFNCRHQLDWISNELGKILKAEQDAEDAKEKAKALKKTKGKAG